MSTYNGSRFLREQLDSILGQSFTNFRMMIRDDGSIDDTAVILQDYAARDERISLVKDEADNLGASSSFMRLVAASTAEYFMLADQDDVWLRDKMERSFAKICEMAAEVGDEMPLLVFTDLTVVDEHLNTLDPSMWHRQRLDPAISSDWRDLLAQNVVTGCTIIANRAAAAAALPYAIPEMLHDQWLAVNAARTGRLGYIKEPTGLYRQHGSNVAGGIKFGPGYAAEKAGSLGGKVEFFRKAAAHFGGVTTTELMKRKFRLNLRRFFL